MWVAGGVGGFCLRLVLACFRVTARKQTTSRSLFWNLVRVMIRVIRVTNSRHA